MVKFPIGKFRPLTRVERSAVRVNAANGEFMSRGKMSLTKAATAVYGSSCKVRRAEVRKAITAIGNPDLRHIVDAVRAHPHLSAVEEGGPTATADEPHPRSQSATKT